MVAGRWTRSSVNPSVEPSPPQGDPMKITIDKLNGPPPHALSRRDIWAIVNAVPPDWWVPMTIHLKATLPEHSAFERPVISTGLRLNICSRGQSPHVARKEVLRELAIPFAKQRPANSVSQADLAEVDRVIAPILERVQEALAGRIELPERDGDRCFRASRALDAAGYSSKDGFAILRALEAERCQPTSGRLPGWVDRGREVLRERESTRKLSRRSR
jgi:hypothetical protein